MNRTALGVVIILSGVLALPAQTDEMWIPPGEKTDVVIGNWGVTAAGAAHFSFAVPDDLASLDGAEVMVIGKKDRPITYNLRLSIATNGTRHDAYTDSELGLPSSVEANTITAIDASSVFPAELNPGDDVVTLHFQASSTVDVRVIGLRLRYSGAIEYAGLACGPREVLVGFAPETGAPTCISRGLLLEGLLCPPQQFLIGFDPVTGNRRCGDRRVLLAGLSCPPGRFVVGFDDVTGELLCQSLPSTP